MRVGDAVTYELGMQPLRNGLGVARAFDNKIGAWVVAEALRRIGRRQVRGGGGLGGKPCRKS